MTDIYSNIDQARAIAKRLIRHNEDVRRAEVKRDICLYKRAGLGNLNKAISGVSA